jgi:hypothetical protein
MAFPNDLSDVLAFKIHPAIGIARLSMNDDYDVFGSDRTQNRLRPDLIVIWSNRTKNTTTRFA